MYKLREARLREFYVNEMDPKNQQSFDTKAPITSRHGEAMADHSFESLKSNEIRGTDMSDIKFGNTGGWNVITSSEVSDDGKARTDKMLAKTEGVTAVKGGQKEFSGKNEELKTERFDGDANNFTHTTGESSNMELNENIVTGDDMSKRVEKKSSSVSHSTKVIRSSTNASDTGSNVIDNDNYQHSIAHDHDSRRSSVNTVKSSSHVENQKSSQFNDQRNVNENVKLSQDPAVVQEALRLSQQPGTILSRKIERANDSTNMITERKELSDGTIVTTKRYEPIRSDHVDIQATTTSNIQRDSKTTNVNKQQNETTSQSRNVETTKTTSRDEEAFRLSQQPGNLISRDVTMTDANTRMITEKKELSDGTIVTTKRFENVSSDKSSDNARTEHVTKSSVTSTNQTYKTARDEEAFKLSQQPGKVISRDVTMTNPTTRQIVEKKELNDGTIVTTKRFETVGSTTDTKTSVTSTKQHQNVDEFSKSLRSDTKTTKDENVYRTPKDQEAFRLAEQPGKIISRDVTMANPTTRQIVEKKELHDGTIVTTKRFETVDSSSNTTTSKTSTKEHQNTDDFTKSLRSDTKTTKAETVYRTPKDEEAFRLAEKPGKVISHDVTLVNPTTRQIVEKKELHDGTIVTTKRFERIDENVDIHSKNVKNVEDAQNIKKVHTTTQQNQPKPSNNKDLLTQREVVEEIVTKKIFDTSCQCPSGKDKHDHKAREFIDNERNNDKYDITTEIIVQQNEKKVFNDVEKTRDETIRKEEIRKLEQKRIDEQIKRQQEQKITRELEVDSAHRAFASSLRSVTPPLDKSSTNRVDRRSPSRETSTSRYSSSTLSTKKSSNVDVRHTNSLDRRTVTKSPEKYSSLDRRTPSKSPEKYPSIDRRTTPKSTEKSVKREPSHSPEKYPTTDKRGLTHSPDKYPTSDKKILSQSTDKYPSSPKRTPSHSPEKYPSTDKRGLTHSPDKYPTSDKRTPSESPDKYPSSPKRTPSHSPEKYPSTDKRGLTHSPEKYPTTDKRTPSESPEKYPSSPKRTPSHSPEKYPSTDKRGLTHSPEKYPSTDKRGPTHSPEKYPSTDKRTPSHSPEKYPSTDKRTPSESPEKYPLSPKRTPSHSPEKYPSADKRGSTHSPEKYPTTDKHTPSESPEKYSSSPKRTPSHGPEKYPSTDKRGPTQSPENYPSNETRRPSKSPDKNSFIYREPSQSPERYSLTDENISTFTDITDETTHVTVKKDRPKTGRESPRDVSPDKYDINKSTVTTIVTDENEEIITSSTHKRPSVPRSHPRDSSPVDSSLRKSQPSKPGDKSRSTSPQKQQPYSTATYPRESSPVKSSPSTSRGSSPQKNISSLPRDFSPSKPGKKPTSDYEDDTDEILTTTVKIDSIDKTLNDLKIIQTIDSKDMSATTSVSDLEYISASDHKKMITDLDGEEIQVNINIENVNQLDDLQIKTTISEINDDKVTKKAPKGDKKPFNRSETFEERAKKLIGVTPDEQVKDVPNYLKPTKASQAPVKGNSNRVSEIRERKAKIEEIEKFTTTTNKKKSLTNATTDFILHEKTNAPLPSSPERSPTRKQPTESKTTKDRTSNVESTTKVTNSSINVTNKTINVIDSDENEEIISTYTQKRPSVPSHSPEKYPSTDKRGLTHSPDKYPTTEKHTPSHSPEKYPSSPKRTPSHSPEKYPSTDKRGSTHSPEKYPTTEKRTPSHSSGKYPTTDSRRPSQSPDRYSYTDENISMYTETTDETMHTTVYDKTNRPRTTSPNKPDSRDYSPSKTPSKSPDKKKTETSISVTENRRSSKVRDTVDTNKTGVTERKCSRSPTRTKAPETHITVAQITISPSRGITSKSVTKTTTVQSNKNLKVSPHIKHLKHTTDVSSTEPESDRDTDQELIRNIDKAGSKSTKKKLMQNRKDTAPVTKTTNVHDKEKVTRTFSEKIIKNDKSKTVTKETRESPKKESKRPVKCITTKTINLTNINGTDKTTLHSNTLDNVEIDINVHQAKSSREPSPNKVVPIPVQTDEEVSEEHILHPHKVTMPEDETRRPKSTVRNVPIFQEETKQYVGLEITEVSTENGRTILEEEEIEEHERILNSSTLEKADRKRNSVQIDALSEDDEEEHSHLLSVSQKVNKFNETVEELKKPKKATTHKKDKDYTLEDVLDDVDDQARLSINEKVSKFSKTSDETRTVTKQKVEDTLIRSIDEVDENLVDDECLLSVSDKVNKFIATAEKIGTTAPQKSPELVKNVMKQTTKHVRDKFENINDSFLNNEKISTLERDTKSSTKTSDITLKSTEAIKKAREVFETNSKTSRDINRQNDILSRPSVFEGKRTPVPERKVYEKPVHEKTPDRQSPHKDTEPKSPSRRGSSDRTPIYMKDQVSTKKDLFEKKISSSKMDTETSYHKPLSPQSSYEENRKSVTEETYTPTRKVSSSDKHYMQHTVASLEHVANTEIRELELHRTSRHEDYETRRDSSVRSSSKQPSEPRDEIFEAPRTPTKFGVELKKTDSFKGQTTRKVSIGSDTINIEEIFDLEELERLLEIVVGYEQRRRIRSQIRIVKKKIEETRANNEFKARYSTTRTTTRSEPVVKKQVVERKIIEKSKVPRDEDSRVKTVTTTTTTTTRISSDKEPKVISKTTKVTSSASPRTVIETINKSNKGKITENVVNKNVKRTSATSNTQKSSTMRESRTETDCITSSYGVGPTENGMPLFGLKALKKKSPAVVESKTTGTIVSEVSYSENGGPAVVQRKTTKYSSDPSDFTHETDVKSKSVTERKDSRGGIYSVTKVEKIESDKKSTPKVIRNGSVKELKEKFVRKDSSSRMSTRSESKRSSIDNESETYSVSKTVKSSSSSTKSFLNNDKKASNVKEVITYMKNADEVMEEGDTKEDAEARALLNKFFGASALMTTIESSSGLSKEFLSTGGAKNKTKSSAAKTKTVTSYSSGSTKAQNINDIWDVDLLKKLLDTATNYDDRRKIRERIRQIMADKEACAELVKNLSTELEVAESSANSSGSSLNHTVDDKVESTEEGESSLLLSLLPGILQNPKYRNLSARQILTLNLSRAIAQQSMGLSAQNSPTLMNSEHNNNNFIDNNNDRLGHDFHIEDSGTESGEDLRLLAANIQSNLGNHMDDTNSNNNNNINSVEQQPQNTVEDKNKHVDTLGTDLLGEVTAALEKLQQSMNLGEIDLDENKKTALLSLVNRLQIGLISNDRKVESNIESADSAVSVTSPMSPENYGETNDVRRGSGGNVNRFNKRKNRANRHTVGVTREELADARRIIEELKFIDVKDVKIGIKPSLTAPVNNSSPTPYNSVLTRQISEPVTLMRPSQFVPKEMQADGQGKPKNKVLFKQSVSLDQPTPILKSTFKQEIVNKIDRNLSGGSSNNSSSNKIVNIKNSLQNDAPTDESSSSEDEDEMINTKYYNNVNTQNGKFRAKENFLRNQHQQEQIIEKSLNYSSGDENRDTNNTSRQPKYMSKKMKMKRANTVDIPKSYSFVNTFDLMNKDSADGETAKNTYQNRASNTGLKTTFTAGNAPMPPKFTPKTENDKKFMAFIQKQNTNVVPTYVNPTAPRNDQKQLNWTNKFGNLKTKFEDGRTESPKTVVKIENAAANFWKNIEKDKPSAKVSPLPAIPIKNGQTFIKTLPVSTDKFPWKNTVNNEKIAKLEDPVVPKKKAIIDTFVPKEQPPAPTFKSIPEPNKLPVLKPATVNNFSHAPMSVFKPPISRKLSNNFKPIQNTEEIVKKSMPTITNGVVKQMAESGYNVNDNSTVQPRKIVNSPTRSIANSETNFVKVNKPTEPKAEPWAVQPKSERVLSLAASKFENVPTVHLASHLNDEPVVRFRQNPLYNGTFEKRSSLPSNAHIQFSNSAFEPVFKDKKKDNITSLIMPKETTFVITDFTQPTSVSTYAPPEETPTIFKPTLTRQDSLTNPSKEPLVLTCDRTVISPREPKPMDFLETQAYPTSPQYISNDNSIGSICDDLEHELDDLGESIECQVAVSKVMKAPVAQTAYTQSSELTSLNGQKKENIMIQSLHDSLKKLQQKSPTPEKKQSDGSKRLSQDSSNSSIDFKILKMPAVHDTHNESQSRLSQDSSNSSIDSKLPPLKAPIAAVPETAYSFVYKSPPPRIQVKSPSTDPPPSHVLFNNVSNRVNSIQALTVPPKAPIERSITPPGMYGVPQHVIDAKQKTVASFLIPARTESLKIKSNPLSVASSQRHTQPATRKISLQVKPMMMTQTTKSTQETFAKNQKSMNSLARSKTMPSLAKVELLDESNIDDAFEELLSSSNL